MNSAYAVWIDGKQIFAGSESDCQAVANNHNALYAGTVYHGAERVVVGQATVAYLGD